MIWWATQPGRARQERATIADLEESVPWLTNVSWRLGVALALSADFEIVVDGNSIGFTITFPDFFPDAPPSIKPRVDVRVSGHQYGAGGELCLEFRADNWSPAVTGAMMIESAHRLISGERDEQAGPVPSAHRTTLGQEVRSSSLRFLISSAAHNLLNALPEDDSIEAALVEHKFGDTWIACPIRVGAKENPAWSEPAPLGIGTSEHRVTALRIGRDARLPQKLAMSTLQELLAAHGLGEWLEATKYEWGSFLLIVDPQEIRLITIIGAADDRSLLEYKTIDLPKPAARLPGSYLSLATKKVGIVGCGSIGSKVAVSLARTGIQSFLLIDPDIFLPDNVVRNELDLRAVGVSKGKALRQNLLEVNRGCDVTNRALRFGGQESADSTASAMSALADCDLIIDATASPEVFNLCAAVSRAERKPMVWGLVYGGGIGGLIARARPDVDPVPLAARNQIGRWYAERGKPWIIQERGGYDGEDEDGAPLVASDADVTVVAAHLARLSIDTLLAADASIFPYSAYAIGLAGQWIFDAPFDTWPIGLSPEGAWGPEAEANAEEVLKTLLTELLPKEEDDAG